MDAEGVRALVERYVEAYNAFDVEGMLACLAPDVVFRNVSGGEVTVATDGIEAFEALALQSAALFSSREQRIRSLAVDGDKAVAGIDYWGLLAADIPGGPRAGEEVSLQGESVFALRDGSIVAIEDRS